MRLVSLVVLLAFASSCTAVSAATNTDKTSVVTLNSDMAFLFHALTADHKRGKRSLRQYDFNELAETDSDDKERGIDMLDDVAAKVVHTVEKLPKNVVPTVEKAVMKMDDIAGTVMKYPAGLSESTLQQLARIDQLMRTDTKKASKTSGKSMRRVIADFPVIKRVPEKYLESHIGCGNQLFDDKRRLLSAGMVLRPASQGGDEMLLISSTNPTKNDWLLPKGGWDKGESIEKAALREVIEGRGVNGQLLHRMGKMDCENNKGEQHRYYPFIMRAVTVYDDWAESLRGRIWVPFKDGIKLLGDRKEMVDIVVKAQKMIKEGRLAKIDDSLANIKLDEL